MPPKKGKGKGKKGKKGKKKKDVGIKGLKSITQILKELKALYELKCKESHSSPSNEVRNLLKQYADDCKLLVKFVLVPGPADQPPVSASPLISSIRATRYVHFKELYIWDINMTHEDVASLALLLEQSIYQIQYIELMDCKINSYAIARFARSFAFTNLNALLLDYNQFSDEGCERLCHGLLNNKTLTRLSLCYCNLGPKSGEVLGNTVCNTAIMDLYLDGNTLECEGVMELIKLLADQSEIDAIEREEAKNRELEPSTEPGVTSFMSAMSRTGSAKSAKSTKSTGSSKKKGKGKKGKKGKRKSAKKNEPPPPPPVGPWIQKLHLVNNGIDSFTSASTVGPVMCMRLFRKLITHSSCLKELDLDDNLIGDLGGRELLEAMMDRKEAGLDSIKARVTHRLNANTFSAIVKIASGLKKKGKKKKKGKAGKKRI